MYKKQRGITLIGFIFMSAFIVMGGITALKVVPVYIKYFAVVRSINNLDLLPKDELKQSPEAGIRFLKEYLARKLYINEIRTISKRDMNIKRTRKGYMVSVPYQVEKNLVGNVYLIFKFKPSYEVSIEKR